MYSKLSNEIQTTARRDKNSHLTQLCKEIEDHSNNSRSLFKGVKDLTSKSAPRLAVIKDENGKVLTESEEIKDRWKRYYEGLFASREVEPGEPIDIQAEEPDILLSEVSKAIQKLKANKSPGIDEIPGELLKNIDERCEGDMATL